MVRARVFAAVTCVLWAGGAAAQGIDCSKARTPIEKAICASPELIALDRQIGAAYADAVARQPDRAAALRSEALAWLRARDAACSVANAQMTRCLSGQMTTRLAQLAPPVVAAAPPIPAPNPTQLPAPPREPAIPSAANPPAPAATIEPASVPAAEQSDAVLRVTSPGRFALAAHSATGVALQLVDQLTGPADPVGEAGVRDGRTDVLLDVGTYRLRAFAAKGAQGEVRLTAEPFHDAAPPRALPPPGETWSAALRDGEQRAFWVLVPPSGTVLIEAAGRALADLRLWRAGRELTALEPQGHTIEPAPGHTMLDLRLAGKVEPGVYLAIAYGGAALPWADGSTAAPFHVRGGLRDGLAEGWAGGPVGPFGSERFEAPAFAARFRLDLPAPQAAELRVDNRAAEITKTSREPHAVLRGEPGKVDIVEVRGAEGQAFTLRASAPATQRSVTSPGRYFIAAVSNGAGADEAPPTVLLQRTDPKVPAEIVASSLPRLSPNAAWRGRFNLRGPTSLLFENAVGGAVRVTTSGLPLGSSPGGFSQYDVPADTYILRLQPAPGVQGVIDVTVGAPGAQPSLPAPLPPDPVIPLGVQEIKRGQSLQLAAQTGPGLEIGLSARSVPVALAEGPLALTQPAGGSTVTVPVTIPAGGRLVAREIGGAELPVADAPAPEGGRAITIPASDRPRTVVLAFRRSTTTADIPPPPALASVPTLRPGAPVPFDLARGEKRGFALDVAQGGLFRVETLGRLHTTGHMASAFVPELDTAEANGTGENMVLQDWLRAGRYRVDVQAADSAGHLSIAASPAPLLQGAALDAGSSVRATMPAGSGVAFPVRIEREGRYALDLLALGKPFTVRLDDAEGWPVTRPGPVTTLEQKLRPGTYRLLLSPEPVERRAVVRLREIADPVAITGHGPHALPFGAAQSATWREPPGRADARVPDVWTFDLAGPAKVTLIIDDGMVAEIKRGDESVTRLTKRWQGRLEAGAYRVEATSLGRNDRLDYAITLAATELQPGETRHVTLPATIPFVLAEPRIATLTSWGTVPVKAVLRGEDGSEIVRAGARTDDWNVAISRPLPAGSYRWELAAALPPAGSAATERDPGVVAAADSEDKPEEGDDKADTDDQDAQTTTRAEHADSSADAPSDAPEQAVDVQLALPTGASVQAIPVPEAAPGTLIAAQAHAAGTAVLALERRDGEGWRTVALQEGVAPVVAAPADDGSAPWRVEAWGVDTPVPVPVRVAVVSAQAQAPGGVELRKLDGLDVAAARVSLAGPGALLVDGATAAGGWPGHGVAPIEGGQAVAQGGEIWLLAGGAGPATIRPLDFDAERVVTVPPDGAVALLAPSGRLRLWRALSGAGQPGFSGSVPAGVAPGSAIAAAGPGVVLRNAGGREALPTRVAALDLAAGEPGALGPVLLPPLTARTVPLPGPGRVFLTLSAGTGALLADATVWTGDAPLSRDVFAAGSVTLINTTDAPAPVAIGWTQGQPEAPLQAGDLFKRFFGAAGSFETKIDAGAGATLAVAGDAELSFQGADGTLRRGRVLRVAQAGRVAVTHGPGAVVLSMAADAVSPWPQATPVAMDRPGSLALAGPAMALALSPERTVLLHATTTAPVLLGIGDRPPELFASGAEFHRALPPGLAILRVISPHDGPLSGTIAVDWEDIRPAREGVGESVAVAPGGSVAWGFSLRRPTTIGVGVRAEPDRAQVQLLDAAGAVRGEGVAQLQALPAGRYVLEARVPPDAAPSLLRPALVGIKPASNGPPQDVIQNYLALVGLKPTEPGK